MYNASIRIANAGDSYSYRELLVINREIVIATALANWQYMLYIPII